MPLRITLKPYERLIVNGACIRNGSRNGDFLVENQCKFLRESEIIHESEADTACKKLCVTLQIIYLTDDPSEAENLFVIQAREILEAMPSTANLLAEINEKISAKQYHHAIKAGRKLIAYESSLTDRLRDHSTAA